MLIDPFRRHITYLRLSVTDRCNLRCRYCMPEHGVAKLDHNDILTYEEFLRVVTAAASEGMTKIRLTGGEPLVRRGLPDFIREIVSIPGILDLRLTTNGVLLAGQASELLAAGIKRVNISLDSLNRETFRQITGRDEFESVWRGIQKALETGFDKVKVNVVIIRGTNDHELMSFVRLIENLPIELRFIEFMPLGRVDFWSRERVVSVQEIKDRIRPLGELIAKSHLDSDGPARVYTLPGAVGTLGFISPVTDHFCETCNRLRLTADGKLRLCLLSNREMDLRGPLRDGATMEELKGLLKEAVNNKPGRHLLDQDAHSADSRGMSLIGG